MASVIALSASHLAHSTANDKANQLALLYRGIAMQHLREMLGAFSRETCTAILSASILLLWEAKEWTDWVSLQHGLRSVLYLMPLAWRQESDLAIFIESQQYLRVIDLSSVRDRFHHKDLSTLQHIIMALQSIQEHVDPKHKYYLRINELLLFLQNLSAELLSLTVTQAFRRVQLIRQWLFWLPAAMRRDGDTISLAIMAQFCAVGVALDYLFRELGGAYLGPLFAGPMEELSRIVYERSLIAPLAMDVQLSLDLMGCGASGSFAQNLHFLSLLCPMSDLKV
ncbi:hypothetical protein BJX62DRAFT_244157 [Aspergillus germanicus]